jgi:hypothetical protein
MKIKMNVIRKAGTSLGSYPKGKDFELPALELTKISSVRGS